MVVILAVLSLPPLHKILTPAAALRGTQLSAIVGLIFWGIFEAIVHEVEGAQLQHTESALDACKMHRYLNTDIDSSYIRGLIYHASETLARSGDKLLVCTVHKLLVCAVH